MAWLLHATRLDRPRLPALLTLHGKRPPPEHHLDRWPGYAGSVPVREGNGAAGRHQLDVYGWPPTSPPGASTRPGTPSPARTVRPTQDAALLVLPLLGLDPADLPRVRGTIDAVMADLGAGGPLLYRYPPGQDGLAGTEGAFLACSFWLVQALAVTGRMAEATEQFDALLRLAGPLGLYAEEIDPSTRRRLGNYPQALTHAALVQAALPPAGRCRMTGARR